jgi:predicted ATPase/DNA-binding winged helix-turn-helix (wHTH) protein
MNGGDGSSPQCWRITGGTRVFRLYPERRTLMSGEAKVELGSRAIALLVVLAENAGRIVNRKHLLERVWQSQVASDSAISSQVSIVRRVLGSDDSIVSVNSQGYVLALPVKPDDDGAPPAPQAQRQSVSLPHPSANSVGRTAELDDLATLCLENRLVTVIGPGGVGKTWLAIALGWRLAWDFPGGVHLVDLGPAKDNMAVSGTVAQALGIALQGGDDSPRTLAAAIGRQRMLLIFDSCEYVADPARELIAALLVQAPNLSVLATSQERLGSTNEVAFRLEPLPPADAATLFVARAQAADRRFQQTDRNEPAIAEICRRLDGNPLALEMAAAQVPTLGVEGVRRGLEQQRFRMLDSRKRNGAPRQATLTAMVEWSHGLLDEPDRQVFRRLARFRGSFSREAAVVVAGGEGADEWDIAARLGRLVDTSLLAVEDGDPPRYRLLETLGVYAAAKLDENGERNETARRHAKYYADLFEHADIARETTLDDAWLAEYGPELDNVRAALDWALAEPGRKATAISLAGSTAQLWTQTELLSEGRRYLDRTVELIDDETPTADAARLLLYAAILWRLADRSRARDLLERSAALYRRVNAPLDLGAALGALGGIHMYFGQYADAKALLDEARMLLTGSNRRRSMGSLMHHLGSFALLTNKPHEARQCFTIVGDLARSRNDKVRENVSLGNLGEVEFSLGAIERAIACAKGAVIGLRALNRQTQLGQALVNLASYLIIHGNDAEARTTADEALSFVRRETGHWPRLCLQIFALIDAIDGRHMAAAQLLGFVNAEFGRTGEIRAPLERRIYDDLAKLLAANVAAGDLKVWAEDGARWNQGQAIEFVISSRGLCVK